VNTQRARQSSSGNARVWVICAHRRYTVRRTKLAEVKPCEKCMNASGANSHKETK